MKTVTSRIYNGEITTEAGDKVDAIFGARSCDDRIVNSPFLIGTTSTLLKVIARTAADIYHGRDKK